MGAGVVLGAGVVFTVGAGVGAGAGGGVVLFTAISSISKTNKLLAGMELLP